MSKILIANIGNRNICLNGQLYFDIVKYKSISFLEWTKDLFEKYAENEKQLDINIINPLVLGEIRPDKIILYYSDQSSLNTRTDQDTIYEAKLMKRILVDKYHFSENEVITEGIKVSVINTGDLIKEYRRRMLALKKQGYKLLTICDAGGTAQQKMALKIAAEYILDHYEIKYAEKNELISDVSINEYRNIIDAEQAIKLLKYGEIKAACNTLNISLVNANNNHAISLLQYLYYRFYGIKDKMNWAESNCLKKNYNEKINQVISEKNVSNNPQLNDAYGKLIQHLLDKFYKVEFYKNINNHTDCILSFAQFYEYLLNQYFISSDEFEFGKPFDKNNNADQKIQLQNFINENYPKLENKHKASIESVSTQVLLLKTSKNNSMSNLASLLSPYIGFTDDTLAGKEINVIRNSIAHDGLFISDDDMKKKYLYFYPLVDQLKAVLSPVDDNPFILIMEEIETLLRT
jgi:hypothetical protein